LSSLVVESFWFDDDNEDKLWSHSLTPTQVLQVLDSPHTIKRNRKERRASHLIVGRDHQGRCIAIPVEPTHERGLWRPVTAWFCKEHEEAWLPGVT
jgi:hypothetical protein